jgi:antitoxin component YwqK of YwqJK toxin-antitoxin module
MGLQETFGLTVKIMDETEYFNGHNVYILKPFYDNGKVKTEIPYADGKINGIAKKILR